MSIARFAAYAAAFEKSYESDDWASLEVFFAEDAVYEAGMPLFFGGRFEGRAAILGYFKKVLDRFDRRFDSRELSLLEGPTVEENERGSQVRIRGSATYRAAGVPDLVLVLEEIVTFDGDRIAHLEDRYDAEMQAELTAYIDTHKEALGIDLS